MCGFDDAKVDLVISVQEISMPLCLLLSGNVIENLDCILLF